MLYSEFSLYSDSFSGKFTVTAFGNYYPRFDLRYENSQIRHPLLHCLLGAVSSYLIFTDPPPLQQSEHSASSTDICDADIIDITWARTRGEIREGDREGCGRRVYGEWWRGWCMARSDPDSRWKWRRIIFKLTWNNTKSAHNIWIASSNAIWLPFSTSCDANKQNLPSSSIPPPPVRHPHSLRHHDN